MTFGAGLRPASTTEPADWLPIATANTDGTVGSLVPASCDSVLRVDAPASEIDDWWSAYRELFTSVVAVGQRHTATPDEAWFAVWEGHGYVNREAPMSPSPPRASVEQPPTGTAYDRAVDEDKQRNRAILRALEGFPLVHRTIRSYYLLSAPLSAVAAMRYPDDPFGWRNPDLMWPDDRAWIVATDVDFWSLLIGGHDQFLDELQRAVPTHADHVRFTDNIPQFEE